MNYPNFSHNGKHNNRSDMNPPPPNHSQTQLGAFVNRLAALGGRNVQVQEALAAFSPSICSKSSDELFSLLTIESDFEEFFDGIPEVINQKINLKDFQLGNEELARDNLHYRSELTQIKHDIELKSQTINRLEEKFQTLKEQEFALLEKLGTSRLIVKLKEERAIIDSESSALISMFLQKELPIEDYITKFRAKRTLFHQYELRIHDIDKRPLPAIDSKGNSVKFLEK